MRRDLRRLTGGCAVVCTLLTVTSCSAVDTADTELPGVLEQVRYLTRLPGGVTFVDAERAAELLEEEPERFAFIADLGTPLLSRHENPEHRFGLDPADAEAAVTVGLGDHYGYWVGDFDAEAVAGYLAADGFTEGEDGIWTSEEAGVRLQVSDDQITWGNEEFNPALLTEGESVADLDAYRRLVECLGDVYRADFIQGDEDGAVPAYAYGHLAGTARETATVLCVLTDGEETAGEAAELLRSTVEDRPDRYRDAEVAPLDGSAHGVKVTVPDTQDDQLPGRLLSGDADLTLALSRL